MIRAVKKHFNKIICALILLTISLLLFVYIKLGDLVFIKSLLYFFPILTFLLITLKYGKVFFNITSSSLKNLLVIPDIPLKRLHQIILFNLLIIILSFLSLVYYPTRTLLYIVLVSLSGTILFVQVLFTKHLRSLYFFSQTVLISLGLTWGVTLKYPLFFGSSDIIPHLSFTSTVIQQGISGLPVDGYRYFPLYHTLLAVGKVISGLSLQTSYFMILGLVSICFLFLSYLIFNQITKEKKISFIFCLFFLFSREIISASRYLVTRNVAVILTLFILYLVLKRDDKNRYYVFTSLILLFSLSLIITHHLTTLLFLLVLIALLLIKTLIKNQKNIFHFKNYIVLLGVSFVAYWVYVAGEFTRHLSLTFKESMLALLTTQSTDIGEKIAVSILTFTDSIKSLIGNIDQMIIIFLSLFGVLFLIIHWTQTNKYVKVFLILGVLSMPLVIPNPLLWRFDADFLLYRIPMITIIFWIILPITGFLVFLKLIIFNKNNKKIQSIILCGVMFFILCFTAVANVNTAGDVPAISNITQGKPNYFNTSDLFYLNFCNFSLPNKSSYIITDRFSRCYLRIHYQFECLKIYGGKITNNIQNYSKSKGKTHYFLIQLDSGKDGMYPLSKIYVGDKSLYLN